MRMTVRTLAAITLGAATLGCNNDGPLGPGDGSLRTDRASYAVTRSGDLLAVAIDFTYTNHTGGPVYLTGCRGPNPPTLEKRVGSTWVTAYSPIVDLCLGPPVEIASGASYSYHDEIAAGAPGSNIGPQFQVSPLAGTYRAVWAVYAAMPDGSGAAPLLPEASRTSNEFELHEQ